MVLAAVTTVFCIYCGFTFNKALSPYVTFRQAVHSQGTVQIRGVLADDSITTLENGQAFGIRLRDETGTEATVVYKGLKPAGLEQADSIVAIGKMVNGHFFADKLLVKCPSKYQGGNNQQ